MGAWGYAPLENDTANDWLDTMIWPSVNDLLDSVGAGTDEPSFDDVYAVRAAMDLITRYSDHYYDRDRIEDCISYLDALLAGKGDAAEFFKDWRDPEAAMESVKEQRAELADILEELRDA
jgi:hypothetical protein